MKGLLSKIGHIERLNQDFKTFSLIEMIALIGLIMLNGIMLSMGFEYEFKTQEDDPVTGNDLHSRLLVHNVNKRWKEFKSCF